MKFYTIVVFLISIVPVIGDAAPVEYQLNAESVLNSNGEALSLSGSISMDFPFGLPVPEGNDLAYKIHGVNFSVGGQSINMNGFNYDFFPRVGGWLSDINLDANKSIGSMRQLDLDITQTEAGIGYYEYYELLLVPVEQNNRDFNNLIFSLGASFPSKMLLTYDLHEIRSRADKVVYSSGEIGSPWVYSIESDQLLGTLTINAAPVPVPATGWLFFSGLCGLVGMVVGRRSYSHKKQ
jgi:hypothetical protein